ncbi:unnamed protein product [marine sediment metagenome]|uniref:Glycosyl hydrolases family 38 C-terminal domain-containing protein n=1 Tax=marine sediment metagenome TaxID=412755 RepID=X1AIX4_9ZZZZ
MKDQHFLFYTPDPPAITNLHYVLKLKLWYYYQVLSRTQATLYLISPARIPQKTKQYKTKILTQQLKNQSGNLPSSFSFIQLEGKYLEISAIKKNEFEDKLLIRVYNPTDRETTGKIKLGFNVHKVYLGRLDESYKEELLYSNGVEIALKPKEIKTIILEVL